MWNHTPNFVTTFNHFNRQKIVRRNYLQLICIIALQIATTHIGKRISTTYCHDVCDNAHSTLEMQTMQLEMNRCLINLCFDYMPVGDSNANVSIHNCNPRGHKNLRATGLRIDSKISDQASSSKATPIVDCGPRDHGNLRASETRTEKTLASLANMHEVESIVFVTQIVNIDELPRMQKTLIPTLVASKHVLGGH